MAYTYKGRDDTARRGVEEAHTVAKFNYFRSAEQSIDAGPTPYQPAPIRKQRKVAKCGTCAGWAKHAREETPACRRCLDAVALYQRTYRARKAAA